MWQGGPARIAELDAAAFRARREELRLGPLVIHANYLINLAAAQPMLRTRSIQGFHDEMVRAVALGADFLVVHPGARGEGGAAQAISTIVESVKQAAKRVPMGALKILVENTAGMGAAVGSRLEEVGDIVARLLKDLPVGACLDTAHLFAAGYDIKSESGLAATIEQLERTVELENVPVFHANDSKVPLGGRVDRHEHIGKGKIGREAFMRILQHPLLSPAASAGQAGRAFLAETPIDRPGDDRRNVAMLWELAGLKEQAPAAEKGFSMLTPALQRKLQTQRSKKTQSSRTKKSLPARSKKAGTSKRSRTAKMSRRRG
jgi:deoxyribonuclease-4